jgi:hypothetical protein
MLHLTPWSLNPDALMGKQLHAIDSHDRVTNCIRMRLT